MTQTIIQRAFGPLKRHTPNWFYNPVRSLGTAFIGPIRYYYRNGYFRSCFKMSAVASNGEPLPWYTYPCIDFLKNRDFGDKVVLEFGGGQSTRWWASRARRVITFEGNLQWFKKIQHSMPMNVELHYVSMESKKQNVSEVESTLSAKGLKYDIVVIDGLFRSELIPIALAFCQVDGVVICDNAEGYGFWEGFKDSGYKRVDFFGSAPGVVLPHCTSIYFHEISSMFDAQHRIPIISENS